MKLVSRILFLILMVYVCMGEMLYAQTLSTNQNYVVETTVKSVGRKTVASLAGLPVDSANKTIQYFDGLGRSLQTVIWQGSPGKRDLVTPVAYDAFGRQELQYLPYAAMAGTGAYKTTGITDQQAFYAAPGSASFNAPGVVTIPAGAAFSKTVFEASPLNRVVQQGNPGTVWQPGASRTTTGGRTVVSTYGTNNASVSYATTGFAVRLYNAVPVTVSGREYERTLSGTGYYGAGQLLLTTVKDENWTEADGKAGTVEEYKDKNDRVVLKRLFNKEGTNIEVLSTYYVYDDFGNLSFVLPPGANPDAAAVPTQTVLDNFAYQYRYDVRLRLIEKKIPGKGWEFMVYNVLNQLVGSQDALQRAKAPQEWLVSKYNAFGNVVQTGIYTYPSGTAGTNYRVAVQALVTAVQPLWENRVTTGNGYSSQSWPLAMSVLTINYYDDYAIPGLPASSPYNLSASYSSQTKGLLTVSLTGVLETPDKLWTVNYYDKEARVVRSLQQHYKGASAVAGNYDDVSNVYSFAGELKSSIRRHYVNGVEQMYQSNRMVYDHQGRIRDTYQKTGDNASTTNPEVLLSRKNYNEIGQLSSKQLHSVNTGTSFMQTVKYKYNSRGWIEAQSAPLFAQELKYNLDTAGNVAQFNGSISRQKWGLGTGLTHWYNYTYDKLSRLRTGISDLNNNEELSYNVMGNITSLIRRQNNVAVDQLSYSYTGNWLSGVTDAITTVNANFQLPGLTSYTPDVNGNLISRLNSAQSGNNLSQIQYNYLNLPKSMLQGTNAITYRYSASGEKLAKLVPSVNVNNEYIGGIHYEGGALKFVATEEGRVVRIAANNYSYEYTLADHLGNGRLFFNISAGVAQRIQEVDYYVFGLDIQTYVNGTTNKYKYNGKEKQDEEKMYDYGARFYDPVIGRFSTIDPKAELGRRWSPYNYGFNNPIKFVDPDGMWPEPWWLYTLYKVAEHKVKTGFGLVTAIEGAQDKARNVQQQQDPGYVANVPEKVRDVIDKGNEQKANNKMVQGMTEVADATLGTAGVLLGGIEGTLGSVATKTAVSTTVNEVENVAVKTLNPYELTPTHGLTKSKKAFSLLKADIQQNGVKEAVSYVEHNGTKFIVDGHHRVRAAKEVGIKSVPVNQVNLPYGGYKNLNDLIYSRY